MNEPERKKKGPPFPNSKKFSKEYQPSPEAKSRGQYKLNARLRIQRELETTIEELLKDPSTNNLILTDTVKGMAKDKTVAQAIANLIIRDAFTSDLHPRDRVNLLNTLIKAGYGDKVELSGDKDNPPEFLVKIIKPE